MSAMLKIIGLVLVLPLVLLETREPGIQTAAQECYPNEHRSSCFSPDYYLNWRGKRCEWGSRGGLGPCWPWFIWYMEGIYFMVGITVVLAVLGCICGPLCGSDWSTGGAYGCFAGFGIFCPCCFIPLVIYLFTVKIKCELCGMKMKSHDCGRSHEAFNHRQSCLEKNRSKYDNIPDSSKYTCKKCETNLKVWPMELRAKSVCIKCDENDEIVSNGSNLHICFTCAASATYNSHHLCGRHGTKEQGLQGTRVEVDWENLNKLSEADLGQTQSINEGRALREENVQNLPHGWKLITNPVTGAPYGLCDPSGEIKPLVDNHSLNDNQAPPPYADAAAISSPPPLANTWNEKMNMEAANWKNKSQRMMRQSSIEMNSAARRMRDMVPLSESLGRGRPQKYNMVETSQNSPPYPV